MTGPPPPALQVGRLLLWRHGRTEWNVAGRFQGQSDPPLDEHGRIQAERAAAHLAADLTGEDTVIVSSDLVRTADTAAPLAARLGVTPVLDPRLREHSLGCWEGLTRDEVAERYPDQYADWVAGRPVRGRGGEDPGDVGPRATAALADLPPASTAVVVTHGGTAGRVLERLLRLGPEHRRIFAPLDNCAWSELVFQRTRWRLIRHNIAVVAVEGRGTDGRAVARDARATPEAAPPSAVGDADAAD